jgi:hypothetical protein
LCIEIKNGRIRCDCKVKCLLDITIFPEDTFKYVSGIKALDSEILYTIRMAPITKYQNRSMEADVTVPQHCK